MFVIVGILVVVVYLVYIFFVKCGWCVDVVVVFMLVVQVQECYWSNYSVYVFFMDDFGISVDRIFQYYIVVVEGVGILLSFVNGYLLMVFVILSSV